MRIPGRGWQYVERLITSGAVLSTLLVTGLPGQLTTFDVSPDAPFGAAGRSPSGRVLGIVIDPSNENILYAASEWAGIWKSTNHGQTWSQASQGLRSGITQFLGTLVYSATMFIPVLAIDDRDPSRLLYATQQEDGRLRSTLCPANLTPCNFGGLYASLNGASTWGYVNLDVVDPSCRKALIQGVGYGQGRAFVLTQSPNCEILSSLNPQIAGSSTILQPPPPPYSSTSPTSMAVSSGGDPAAGAKPVLFLCQGGYAYRKVDPVAASPAWEKVALPNGTGCYAIAAVPKTLGLTPDQSLVVLYSNIDKVLSVQVATVDFSKSSATVFPVPLSGTTGSGAFGVWAPARPTNPSGIEGPGTSYDVYAADALQIYHWRAGKWDKLDSLHNDSWAMAFSPKTYDPYTGLCDAFAGTDGGISYSFPFSPLLCIEFAANYGWRLASSGLHLTFGTVLSGVAQPVYPFCTGQHLFSGQPCPVLYQASADTDTWVTTLGGVAVGGSDWFDLKDGLGDSDEVFVDPGDLVRAMAVRNTVYEESFAGNPPTGGPWYNITPKDNSRKWLGPAPTGVAQVLTEPNEQPRGGGDFLAVESEFDNNTQECKKNKNCAPDRIVRNSNGGLWFDIAPGSPFGPGEIGGIYPSGGHQALVVYVLTSVAAASLPDAQRGQIWRGEMEKDGSIHQWKVRSGFGVHRVIKGYNLFVNPYDDEELWAVDLGDKTIKRSRDAGGSWFKVPILKDVATNYGEFEFDCGKFVGGDFYQDKRIFGAECPMTWMGFVRDQPNVRVAVMYPGGVAFSRNSGDNWIPLNVTNAAPGQQPIELPNTAFYDPTPNYINGNFTSLYIGLEGKGVKRVEGDFRRIQGARLTYCPNCPKGGTLGQINDVQSVVRPLDITIPLHQDPNGLWIGDIVFDSAQTRRLAFQFVINGRPTEIFDHMLTDNEIKDGSITLSNGPLSRDGR